MDSEISPTLKRPWIYLALAGILILAWYLRVDGSTWGLPFRLHPDEMKYVAAGAEVHGVLNPGPDGEPRFVAKWNPEYFRNPPGFSYMNALWFPAWVMLMGPLDTPDWVAIPKRVDTNRRVSQAYYNRPWDLVYASRHLAALLGTATVLLVFWIGYDWLGVRGALMAAGFHAVSFLSVREPHFAVNDTAMTFFVTLGVWLALRSCRLASSRWFYASAAVIGVAVATKYNAVAALPALLVMRWLCLGRSETPFAYKRFIYESGLAALIVLGVFLLICPFPIIDPSTFWAEIKDLAAKSGRTWPGQESVWSGFLLLEALLTSEGVLGFVSAVAGIFFMLRQKRWELLFFPACYTLLVVTHALFFMRFAMPLLPWMALFAAARLDTLAALTPRRHLAAAALFLLTAVQPLAQNERSNWLFHQPNTRVQFLKWMATEKVLENEAYRIATHQFCLPFVYRGGVATPGIKIYDNHTLPIDRLAASDFSIMNQVESPPIQAVAVSTFSTFPGLNPNSYKERRQAAARFTGSARPHKVFQPFRGAWRPQAADVEDTYHPVHDLWNRQYPGPAIEIFTRNESQP